MDSDSNRSKRRELLRAAFGFAAAIPGLRALATDDSPSLCDAWTKAHREGRGLLIVPDLPWQVAGRLLARHENGCLAGEVLTFSDDETRSRLALVDVICAELRDLEVIAPEARLPPDPALIILEPTDPLSRVDPAPCVWFMEIDRDTWRYDSQRSIPVRGADRRARRQELIDRASQFVRTALGPDLVTRAASHTRALLDRESLAKLESTRFGAGECPDDLLRRGAALLLERVDRRDEPDRTAIRRALADYVERTVVNSPPQGARWARNFGCGWRIEGEEEKRLKGCGMGHASFMESRFLCFLDEVSRR